MSTDPFLVALATCDECYWSSTAGEPTLTLCRAHTAAVAAEWERRDVESEHAPSRPGAVYGRRRVLVEAEAAVMADRNRTHGEPSDTLGLIAKFWSAYLGHQVTALDAAMLLALLKVARQKSNAEHWDNYVDLAGYAACAGELAEVRDELT